MKQMEWRKKQRGRQKNNNRMADNNNNNNRDEHRLRILISWRNSSHKTNIFLSLCYWLISCFCFGSNANLIVVLSLLFFIGFIMIICGLRRILWRIVVGNWNIRPWMLNTLIFIRYMMVIVVIFYISRIVRRYDKRWYTKFMREMFRNVELSLFYEMLNCH